MEAKAAERPLYPALHTRKKTLVVTSRGKVPEERKSSRGDKVILAWSVPYQWRRWTTSAKNFSQTDAVASTT